MPPTAAEPTTASQKRTILLAEHHGYCHGVKKAVDKTVQAGEQAQRPVYVLGQLIHNQQVIDRLSEQGITTVTSLDEIPPGSTVVIRTHGAAPELLDAARAKDIDVTDATCPDVRLVQNKAIELVKDGYTVVVVGKNDHPEVVGIMAHAQRIPNAKIVAINTPEGLADALQGLPKRRLGLVSQTTQLEDTFFALVAQASRLTKELKVFNTICPATFYRQNAAADLAKQVDVMVVVGGKNSSNTTHLADICKEEGTPAFHVETYRELQTPEVLAVLTPAKTIGVTAGASTPDWLVQEVIDALEQLA